MPPLDRETSRAEAGSCTWEKAETYAEQRAALENERNPATADDPTPWEVTALEFFDALIEAASEPGGLGPGDYDAPMGRDLQHRINKPWIGEFKTRGISRPEEGGRRQYRLYFSEPDIERLLLKAFLGHKTMREMTDVVGDTSHPKSSAKQTKHIGYAMDVTVGWCKQRKVSYRTS
ncbi:hypothetical protein CRM90_23945 [Mycobacterium sp. ENV421]|uniref:hypothetical protein n=1 Tax=Mycobacterium sp. ENV421 TaxID=1213407 RepID=UPI000C9C07F7|nr:hypothetical protein [Mycobacterium sp. ENV421]PND55255.1 hypothetical protein CRM90_23945 [Mycobacterium sp. ENV421]